MLLVRGVVNKFLSVLLWACVSDGSHFGALDSYDANATVTYARAWPIQFHFHTPSENTIDGNQPVSIF